MENCECFKVDMGCSCDPPPPDRPRPFLFTFVNDTTEPANTAQINFTANGAGIIPPSGYTIVFPGTGYRIAPTITIATGPTTTATATCTINTQGQIISVTVTTPGSGYVPGTVLSTITASANNLITLDQLTQPKATSTTFGVKPVTRLFAPPPSGGGVTLASAKINVKLTYTIKTNGITDFTGTFYINGVAQSSIMKVDDTSATYTTVTHYSGEMTLLFADIVTYKISSTESKLYDIVWIVGNFTVKYI